MARVVNNLVQEVLIEGYLALDQREQQSLIKR